MINRSQLWLMAVLSLGAVGLTQAGSVPYAPVVPGRTLTFPADYGSHPEFRTEWWYITGWLKTADGGSLGFQITFFRTKPDVSSDNASAFAPHQLIIAHCAIADPKLGRLWQDQKIRRAGFGLAEARVGDTDVWLDNWSLRRQAGVYVANLKAGDFSIDLKFEPTQPPLINGQAGFSRKGPALQAASYYYSLPHLEVSGTVLRHGLPDKVTGEAWFDHEWSSDYLDSEAAGWDWIGLNLEDGGALMLFRIRGPQAQTRWAGGTLRTRDGSERVLEPADVQFDPLRRWRSERTGITYPVQWRIRAGTLSFELAPLFDDQENDTRLSSGTVYWEGAVRATDAGTELGRGYLELTGYGERLRLR